VRSTFNWSSDFAHADLTKLTEIAISSVAEGEKHRLRPHKDLIEEDTVNHSRLRRQLIGTAAALGLASAAALAPTQAIAHSRPEGLRAINHIVVIYDENHSFDNLYGGWEGVNGLSQAKPANVLQVGQDGSVLPSLPQNDVNLPATTPNAPFDITTYIPDDAKTCPTPNQFAPTGIKDPNGLPGGCTRDIVHRYYQEQYQLNGGKQNRYTAGSDAVGLTQGYYDTKSLPIYTYLHSTGAPKYAIADNLFQGAFGGSFLNHQWLITARTPAYPNAVADLANVNGKLVSASGNDLHSVVDGNGEPNNYPLYNSTGLVADGALTQAAGPNGKCVVPTGAVQPKKATVCGDYAVNTIQPSSQPYSPGTGVSRQLPAQTTPTIGDELSAKGLDWAWYAGGWDNAAGNITGAGWTMGDGPVGTCNNSLHSADGSDEVKAGAVYPYCPTGDFQFHHQPFNYYKNFQQGQPGRSHLQDEVNFMNAAESGQLKPVSFVKPLGRENEHPGYASEHTGSDHLVDLIKAVENGPQASDTLIVVTYDEFGGQWDHVSPPQDGTRGAVADKWGPGTRVPALLISPRLARSFSVDSTSHDTTSILATIEHRFGLDALSTRDARVADFASVFKRSPGRDD
jgi:acid phosphatase